MRARSLKANYVSQEPHNFSFNPFFNHEICIVDDSDQNIQNSRSPKYPILKDEKEYPGSIKIVKERSSLRSIHTDKKLISVTANYE